MNTISRTPIVLFGFLIGSSAYAASCPQLAQQIAETRADIQRISSSSGSCPTGVVSICSQNLRNAQALLANLNADYQKDCVNPPFTPVYGKATPPYYVLTLVYAPPGNQSQLVYADGSSTGTKSEVSNKAVMNFETQVETNFARIDFEAGKTNTDSSSLEIKKTSEFVLTVTSQANDLDHDRDQFYVWTNPQLNMTQNTHTSGIIYLGPVSGEQPVVVRLSAADLKNPAMISDPATKSAVAKFKPSDFRAILNLDPFFFYANPIQGDASRFSLLSRSVQIEGPETATDPVIGQGAKLSDESIEGKTSALATGFSLSVLGGFEWDTGPHLAVFAGVHIEQEKEHTKENDTGTVQEISYNLQSNTIGYQAAYDVYYDNIFRSFAFVPSINPAAIAFAGTVVHHSPRSGDTLTARFSDGSTRLVNVKRDGSFRILGKPGSVAALTYGAQTITLPESAVKAGRIDAF